MMKKGNLKNLADELTRQKENSVDVVVDPAAMEAHVITKHDDEGHPVRSVRLAVPIPSDAPVDFSGETVDLPLTDWAHTQVGQKLGIPKKYYDRMEQEAPDLLTRNINTWLSKDEKPKLVRVLDKRVRAFLSDHYRPIDSYDVMFKFLEQIKTHNSGTLDDPIEVQRCDVTDKYVHVRCVLPHISEMWPGDKTQCMIKISNSEVGAGKLSLDIGTYRMVCTNGMWHTDVVEKVHLGVKLEGGVVDWSEDTFAAKDELLFQQLEDAFKAAVDPQLWDSFVDKQHAAQSVTLVDKPITEIVDLTGKHFDIRKAEMNALVEALSIESATLDLGKTQFTLAQGVTRMAQGVDNYDRQVELEKLGGKIIEMSPRQLESMKLVA